MVYKAHIHLFTERDYSYIGGSKMSCRDETHFGIHGTQHIVTVMSCHIFGCLCKRLNSFARRKAIQPKMYEIIEVKKTGIRTAFR